MEITSRDGNMVGDFYPIKDCKYSVTSEYMPAQFITQEV